MTDLVCTHCKKKYAHKQSLNRHIKICPLRLGNLYIERQTLVIYLAAALQFIEDGKYDAAKYIIQKCIEQQA